MGYEIENMWATMKGPYYERILQEVSRDIAEAVDMDKAVTMALSRVSRAAHAEAATFWFFDRFDKQYIFARAIFGGKDLTGVKLHQGEGIAGQVIASGASAIIPDCQKDPRWAGKVDADTGFTTSSMICVPLFCGQLTFGCLQIINKTDGSLYDAQDLTFVEHLAQDVAQLFISKGLLRGYKESDEAEPEAPEPVQKGFLTIFEEESFSAVEEELRQTPEFVYLSETQRKTVLRHCREIWMILRNTRTETAKPKRGLFRF